MCKKGDRIIFLTDITEDATGDHPDYILAKKDQFGTINEKENDGWYSVYWDGWKKAAFAAEINVDFKLCGNYTPTEIAEEHGITVTGNDTFNALEKEVKEGRATSIGEAMANMLNKKP